MKKLLLSVLFLIILLLPSTCQCENTTSTVDIHNQPVVSDDISTEIVYASWDLERLWIVPVIEISVTNKSGKPMSAVEARVVFYNVDKQAEWETKTTQVVSTNGPAFENGDVRSFKLLSGIGYQKPYSLLMLPKVTFDLYLNGKLVIKSANIEKPDVSIELAIEAAKKLRAMLKDPSSMQIHKAFIKANDKNTVVVLDLSAKNGYGVIVRAFYDCTIEESVCISCTVSKQFELSDMNGYQELDVEKIMSPLFN